MSSNRFYVPSTALEEGSETELPDETGRQIARVLRMREQDRVVLFDGSGTEWSAVIVSIRKDSVSVVPEASVNPKSEPAISVTVCQALVPAERMEFVIQKSTELGASRIIPVSTERVQARDEHVSENRLKRWKRIAIEAAEQSGRVKVPGIQATENFSDCISNAVSEGPTIILWEEEQSKGLKDVVQESLRGGPKHISVLIGPVGGLSVAEAESGRSAGALLAGAGPRILRAETAPIVALTALMYEAGELA